MRRYAVFVLIFIFWGTSFLFAQTSTEEAKKKMLVKTGLYFAYNFKYDNSNLAAVEQEYMNYLGDTKGYTFGIYSNMRLFKGFYYQPEISYLVYNGGEEQRIAMISMIPLQVQLGLHFNWIRPFVAGGAFLNYSVFARDAKGNTIDMSGWDDHSSWGFFYGGGLDILSMFQINFRIRQWMLNFHELKPRNFSEFSAGVSFFF